MTENKPSDALVERLRDYPCDYCGSDNAEAADRIEAQASEIERLREALEWYVAEDVKYMRAALAGDSHD